MRAERGTHSLLFLYRRSQRHTLTAIRTFQQMSYHRGALPLQQRAFGKRRQQIRIRVRGILRTLPH
jgi:hypothetical protein